MPLKVLSGLIVVDRDNWESGSCTIDFQPHAVRGNARGADLREVGASGQFTSEPCKVVSLRKIHAQHKDSDTAWGREGPHVDYAEFDLHDHFYRGYGGLEVEWRTKSGSEHYNSEARIIEISYMVIGETE